MEIVEKRFVCEERDNFAVRSSRRKKPSPAFLIEKAAEAREDSGNIAGALQVRTEKTKYVAEGSRGIEALNVDLDPRQSAEMRLAVCHY